MVFKDDGRREPIKEDIRVVLFQVVRELLCNVTKHANARNVKVCISKEDGELFIIVEDDGVGFDVSSGHEAMNATDGGYGLFNIRERLSYFGGVLEIRSAAGRGTRASVVAPLVSEEKGTGVDNEN